MTSHELAQQLLVSDDLPALASGGEEWWPAACKVATTTDGDRVVLVGCELPDSDDPVEGHVG